MDALLLVLGVGAALLIAYFTYGRWVAGRVFQLRRDTPTPATVLCDDVDYCPTPKTIVFGHHFTSIAGTGPIVGPAIAVMWGWLPAILWVVFGSVFIGAVHDLGSIVVSLRNKGRSVGDIAGDLLGPRVRLIFLGVLVLVLWIVLAIFGLVVASVLRQYPASIFPVLVQIPLAVVIGVAVHRKGKNITIPSLLALAVMYASVIWGDWGPLHTFNSTLAMAPMWVWVFGLLAYAYVASVLPVWTLLQPRDYINALQLISALGLLLAGLVVAATLGGAPDDAQPLEHQQGVHLTTADDGLNNKADLQSPERKRGVDMATHGDQLDSSRADSLHTAPAERPKLEIVAPMVNWRPPGAPPLLPVLFITIACGAVSGFHCLVGSGTSSKQIQRETDARAVGYGSMLTEAFLATLVIAACTAGIGLGITKHTSWQIRGYGFEMSTRALPLRTGGGYFVSVLQEDPSQSTPAYHYYGDDRYDGKPRLLITKIDPSLFNGAISNPTGDPLYMSWDRPPKPDPDFVGLLVKRIGSDAFTPVLLPEGEIRVEKDGREYHLRGPLAWNKQYQSWSSAQGLTSTVGAFVEGAANLIKALGVSGAVAMALMGVMVASFAGTTMDTACRLQRYVIQELARTFLPKPPNPCCSACGYDMQGHEQRHDAGAEGAHASEAPGLNNTDQSESPGSSLRLDPASRETRDAQGAVTCPESGAENILHDPQDAPDGVAAERTPDAVNWGAAVRLASPINPFKWLATTHGATLFAVATAAIMAALPAPGQSWSLANFGNGGLILWPLFGATNQLLGGLAFLVVGAWLIATKRPWWFMAPPAVFMLVIPAWALVWQTFIGNDTTPSWIAAHRWMLMSVGIVTIALEAWLVVEVALRTRTAHAARRSTVSTT